MEFIKRWTRNYAAKAQFCLLVIKILLVKSICIIKFIYCQSFSITGCLYLLPMLPC